MQLFEAQAAMFSSQKCTQAKRMLQRTVSTEELASLSLFRSHGFLVHRFVPTDPPKSLSPECGTGVLAYC